MSRFHELNKLISRQRRRCENEGKNIDNIYIGAEIWKKQLGENHEIKNEEISDIVDYFDKNDISMHKWPFRPLKTFWDSNMRTQYFLILGLIVVSLIVVIRLLGENDLTGQAPPDRTSREGEISQWIAVFVVNASHVSLIRSLNTSNKLDENIAEGLYEATQSLWFGTNSDFNRTRLKEWFRHPAPEKDNESDYDVYFIMVEVSKDIHGLGEANLEIERIDAIKKIAKDMPRVTISNRLPSKACSSYVYPR